MLVTIALFTAQATENLQCHVKKIRGHLESLANYTVLDEFRPCEASLEWFVWIPLYFQFARLGASMCYNV